MFGTLQDDLIIFNANHQPLTLSNIEGLANVNRDYNPSLRTHMGIVTSRVSHITVIMAHRDNQCH